MKLDYRDKNSTLLFTREDVKSNKDVEKITLNIIYTKFTCYVNKIYIDYLVRLLLAEKCFINLDDNLLEFRDISIPFQKELWLTWAT